MDAMTLYEITKGNRETGMEQKYKFDRIFGMKIGDYMSPLFGFNIIKFDDALKTPDGKSTKEWVREKYGQEGLDVILALMGMTDKEE